MTTPRLRALALAACIAASATTLSASGATTPALRATLVFAEDAIPSDTAIRAAGLGVLYRFRSIPGVAVTGTKAAIEGFGARAELVEFDRPIRLMMETATTATGAADVWGDAYWPVSRSRGPLDVDGVRIDGSGVTIGVVDTGVDGTNPDLFWAPAHVPGMPWEPKLLVCTNIPLWVHTLAHDNQPDCDQHVGHGTHVAGIAAGNAWAARNRATATDVRSAPYVGAAPGAKLVAGGLGAGLNVLNTQFALDWMWVHAEQYNIGVVTNSWGDQPDCDIFFPFNDSSNARITDALVEKGITVLYAASNYDGGDPTWTSSQSRNPTPGVISVANYSDRNNGTRRGQISSGSSDGCVASGGAPGNAIWTWPDVAAPGTSITAAAARTGALIPAASPAPFYGTASGTSMATPHVAGIVALMKQANPALTPAQVERILIDTATPWADTIASRGVSGTTMWGSGNATAGSFVDRDACFVSPTDATDGAPDLPHLTRLPDPERFVCRDYRRGHGLVDAYAAVQAALALR